MVRVTRNLTRKSFALLTSLLLVLFWVPGLVSSQTAFAGTVGTTTPGNFEIDGNLVLDDSATPPTLDDWGSVLTGPTGADTIGTADTSVFQTSSKEDNAASTWTAGTSHVDPKNDIGGLYSYAKTILTPSPANEYFYFGFDRVANNGTDFYKIELNQSKLLDQTSDNTLDIPHRLAGDKRISLHDQGGSTIVLDEIDHWTGSAWTCDAGPATGSATGDTCAADLASQTGFFYNVNDGDISMPSGWTTTSPVAATQAGVLHAEQFVELGFNLSVLNLVPACPSPGFGHAMLRNVTGQSNGNLKDYVEPIPIDVQSTCAALHVRKFDSGSGALNGATFQISPDPASVTHTGSVLVTDGDTNTPAVAGHIADPDGTPNGKIDITTAQPNTVYTVTETSPPAGYLLPTLVADRTASTTSTDVCSLTLADCDATGKVVSLGSATFTFHDPRGDLTVTKIDAQAPANNNALAGATFEVVGPNGYDTLVTDGDTSGSATGHVADASSTDGTIKVANLGAGTYAVTESAAPGGYDKDPNTVYITIDSDHPHGLVTDAQGVPNGGSSRFSDRRLPVTLRVIKSGDGGTCDPASPTANCLAGAQFGLYLLTGATPNIANDTLVVSPNPATSPNPCTTGSDGTCTVTVPHWGGTYYWYEVAAPSGYNLPNNQYQQSPATISLGTYPTSGVGPDTAFSDGRPTIGTTATSATVGGTIKDRATLSNLRGDSTGTVTFKLYGPFALNATITKTSCVDPAQGVTDNLLDSWSVTVDKADIVNGSVSYASDVEGHIVTPTKAGKYAWVASYSGDSKTASVSGACGDDGETSTVSPKQPSMTTTTSDDPTAVDGAFHDSATLTGFAPTPVGMAPMQVTFTLYTDAGCNTLAPTGNVNGITNSTNTWTVDVVNGAATSGDYHATNSVGTYYWKATLTGNTNNDATLANATDDCGLLTGGNHERSLVPVLDTPHKYNTPGTNGPGLTATNDTVSIYANNNQITYTITVHNKGAATMSGVSVIDTVSSLATYNAASISCSGDATSCVPNATLAPALSWSINGLPSDGIETLHFSVTVNSGDARTDVILNQAHVTDGSHALTLNGQPFGDTEITQNHLAYPNLSINKCADPDPSSIGPGTNVSCTVKADGLVAPGSSITYLLTVTNTGNADATGVTVTDAVPAHTSFVMASCDSPCTANQSGGTVTWSNITVPKQVGSIPGTAVVQFTVNVASSGLSNGDQIDNVGSFTWSNSGSTTSHDQSGTSATVHHTVGFPVITGSKTADPLPIGDPIPGTANTADGIVHPGDVITYTVGATNTGLAPSSVTITDTIPDGTSYAGSAQCDSGAPADCAFQGNTAGLLTWTMTLPGNSSATVSFQVTVNATDSDGQILSNHGVVNGSNTRTVTHEVTFPIMSVLKSSDPVSGVDAAHPTLVGPNTIITYTLTVKNEGRQDETGFVVTDSVPTGTRYNGDAKCTVTVNCTADDTGAPTLRWTLDVPGGSVSNNVVTPTTRTLTFSVTTPTMQSFAINNTATYTNVHTPQCPATEANTCDTNTTHHEVVFPVINAHKTSDPASGTAANPATVTPGQTITYTVAVTNSGEADATGPTAVTVTDAVPANTTYVAGSATATGGTYDSGTNTVSWTLDVAKGATVDLTFQARVPDGATNGTLIDNTAHFSNVHTPGCQSETCNTETTHHEVRFAILTLAKSSNPVSGSVVQRGSRIDYAITLTNSGLAASSVQTITDTLPSHVTVVSGSASPAFTTASGGTVTWNVTVPAQGTVTLTYGVTVDKDAPEGATLTNVALVDGQCVGNADASACTTDHHVPTGALTLVKHVDKATASYGDTLTYTFDAATTGALNQTGVSVSDVMPKGTAYVAGSAACTDAGTCTTSFDSATKTLTWGLGDMAAGATRHLVFKVTIVKPAFNSTTGLPPATIVNSGAIQSTETPSTPSNQVVTKVVAVLGVKVVRAPKLPFTGIPAQELGLFGLLMVGAGMILTSVRRRQQ